jgi:hypothetical protein
MNNCVNIIFALCIRTSQFYRAFLFILQIIAPDAVLQIEIKQVGRTSGQAQKQTGMKSSTNLNLDCYVKGNIYCYNIYDIWDGSTNFCKDLKHKI